LGNDRGEFFTTLRTGKRPDGYELKEPMPWQILGKMTDGELRALWLYLQTSRLASSETISVGC
jgi:hypothetical protein